MAHEVYNEMREYLAKHGIALYSLSEENLESFREMIKDELAKRRGARKPSQWKRSKINIVGVRQ
jgi:hypothetical protein